MLFPHSQDNGIKNGNSAKIRQKFQSIPVDFCIISCTIKSDFSGLPGIPSVKTRVFSAHFPVDNDTTVAALIRQWLKEHQKKKELQKQ